MTTNEKAQWHAITLLAVSLITLIISTVLANKGWTDLHRETITILKKQNQRIEYLESQVKK